LQRPKLLNSKSDYWRASRRSDQADHVDCKRDLAFFCTTDEINPQQSFFLADPPANAVLRDGSLRGAATRRRACSKC
jgi:hypothetical protein